MGYAATHGRKCAIVIPSTLAQGATHTNFPVCFTVANLPSEMFDADGSYPAKSDGSDVRFSSDSAGDTPMNVEVERFGIDNNPANGFAEIWARIPSFSHTVDTTVYCWWNDPDASAIAADDADEGSQGVWDSNFKGVYHLSEASNDDAGNYKDATTNDNHMTGVSMGMDEVAGAWAGSVAAEFDGSADYLYSTTLPATDYPLVFSAWIYADAATAAMAVASVSDSTVSPFEHQRMMARGDLTDDPIEAGSANVNTAVAASKVGFTTSTWMHIAARLTSATSRTAYVNGVGGTENTTSILWQTMDRFAIGATIRNGSLLAFNGKIDEVRASNIDRAAAWLAAEYAVTNSISSITAGTPASPGGVSLPAILAANMRGGFGNACGGFVN